jgi:hypothetical protein
MLDMSASKLAELSKYRIPDNMTEMHLTVFRHVIKVPTNLGHPLEMFVAIDIIIATQSTSHFLVSYK